MPQTQPIEDHPELRGFLRNSVEWSFTLAMWLLWIYFFLPLISLVLWGFGLVHVYQNLFRWDVLPQLHEVLKMVGLLVVVIFVLLRGWGYYNYYVFGRRNRRKDRKKVSAADIGLHFGLTREEVLALRRQREIVWTELYDEIAVKDTEHPRN